MGFGTARDPFAMTQVAARGDLSEMAGIILYTESYLVQKIVSSYPTEAAASWLRFHAVSQAADASPIDDSILSYLDQRAGRGLSGWLDADPDLDLKMLGLKDLFLEAGVESRLSGRSYLLLGIDDGGEWHDRVDPQKIRSIRWIEPLYFWEVQNAPGPGGGRYRSPNYYQLNRSYRDGSQDELPMPNHGLIHSSRVLRFDGVYLPERALMHRSGRGKSVVDGVWAALARANQSMDSAAHLLRTASLFSYGLNGLSEITEEKARKAVEDRFLSIMYSMSVLKGIPYDPETESIGFESQTFAGVDKLLGQVLDQVSIECDLPRWKLFDLTGANGLNSQGAGETERQQWAKLQDTWRSNNWHKPLLYLGKLALLAKDYQGEKCKLGDLRLFVPPSMEYSPPERLNMAKTHMDTMATAIDKQIISNVEARTSTYGGAEWSDRITLDDDHTEQLRATAAANAIAETGGEEPDPTNPGEPDPSAPKKSVGASSLSSLSQIDRAMTPEELKRVRAEVNRKFNDGEIDEDAWDFIMGALSGAKTAIVGDDATRAQKKIQWGGFTIGLQYRQGDTRHGRVLGCSYGYVEKTRGADGMACDVYLGPHLDSPNIYAIDQLTQDGKFDEHKYVIGVLSQAEAEALYLAAMPRKLFGGIRTVSIEALQRCRI